MELQATSASASCDSLLRRSTTGSLGLDAHSSAIPNGTALKEHEKAIGRCYVRNRTALEGRMAAPLDDKLAVLQHVVVCAQHHLSACMYIMRINMQDHNIEAAPHSGTNHIQACCHTSHQWTPIVKECTVGKTGQAI